MLNFLITVGMLVGLALSVLVIGFVISTVLGTVLDWAAWVARRVH